MLLWIDTETTGLNPKRDHLLEVAWHFTSPELEDVWTPTASALVTPPMEAWDQLEENDVVSRMHETSGLIDDLKSKHTLDISDVEDAILEDIAGCVPEGEPIFLAGGGVHFDLGFIRNWMLRLSDKLHYRVYDVSTLKAFFHEFVSLTPEMREPVRHRADSDIDGSLTIARYFRDYTHFATSTLIDLCERGLLDAPINVNEESNA